MRTIDDEQHPDAVDPGAVDPVAALERRVLRWSLLATTSLAVIGIGWGIVASSQIILFDGIYGVIGIGLTWLSMAASRLVAAGPTPRYPFGREALAPLVIAIQAVALLAACAYAAADAVLVIVDGGSSVSADAALAYGVVTLVASVVVWLLLRRPARDSELLAAESTQWLVGAGLSLSVAVAFAAVLVIDGSDYANAGRYADPALVLVACLVLAPTPVRMIRTTLVELLEGAPDPEVQAPVRHAVNQVQREFDLDDPYLRMTKVGRKLYVEADFVVNGREWDVADEDEIRRSLQSRLVHLPYTLWLNVELSSDPDWVA